LLDLDYFGYGIRVDAIGAVLPFFVFQFLVQTFLIGHARNGQTFGDLGLKAVFQIVGDFPIRALRMR
jgi:hypothetical protein